MDWQKQVIKLIDNHFKSLGISYTPKQKVDSCLMDFFNYQMKLISPIPRKVYISDKIKTRKIQSDNFLALLSIENKIIKGQSVLFHQSKSVLNPTKTDDLLNDWLIHHLHLSDWKDNPNDKFYARTKDVLFVAFSKHEAFFIDIRPHGKNGEPNVFAKKELLEIIDNNWPQVMEPYYWKGVTKVEPNCSDEDIKILRQKGYTLGAYNVNGKAIRSPGIGISTTGYNIQVGRKADEVCRILHESSQYVADEEKLKQILSEKTNREINKLDLNIQMVESWPFFVLYEANSNYYI